jgi:hypothetical protein
MNIKTISLSSLLLIVGFANGNENFYRLKLETAQKNKQKAYDAEQEALEKLSQTPEVKIHKQIVDELNAHCYRNNWDNKCHQLSLDRHASLENVKKTEYYNKSYRPFVINLAYHRTLESGLSRILNAIEHNKNDDTTIEDIIDGNDLINHMFLLETIGFGEGIPARMEIEDIRKGRDSANAELHAFFKEAKAHKNQ